MDHLTRIEAQPAAPNELETERKLTLQKTLRSRHSLALSTLMAQREDLHGVHALADHIDESLRWSA
jgi:hypothetical protein